MTPYLIIAGLCLVLFILIRELVSSSQKIKVLNAEINSERKTLIRAIQDRNAREADIAELQEKLDTLGRGDTHARHDAAAKLLHDAAARPSRDDDSVAAPSSPSARAGPRRNGEL